MSESYDVELSRALKESAAKELDGWEFSPAMRAQVLERIRAEEAGQPSPAAPAPRRFNPAPVLRPLAWVAVAAAAVLVVVNVGVPKFGMSTKQEASTTSAPSPAVAPSTPPTDGQGVASTANTKDAPGPVAPAGSEGQAKKTASNEPAQPPAPDQKALAQGPAQPDQTAMKFATATAVHPVVTLEMPMSLASAPEATGPAGALEGPKGKGVMGIAAAPPQNVAMASGAQLVTVTTVGVQQLNADGSPAWMQPVPDLNPLGTVAVAADGRVAVSNGGNGLTILDHTGASLRTIAATAAVSHLAWSADGRLASVEGSLVFVYDTATGKPAFFVDAGINPALAFLPDGALATYGDLPNDPDLLAVTDRKGAILLEARPTTGGHGLAVTDGGKVLVAGGQAYDRAGQPLWTVPLVPAGLASLGSDKVVAWNAHTVLVLDGRDGHTVLEASWKGAGRGVQKVVPSADGKHVAILAQTDEGPVVWVLNTAGAVTYTEKLASTPVDLALTGSHLVIMLEDSVLMRELPQ